MIKNSQKGVSLVIVLTLLMMVLMTVVAIAAILGVEIRISGRVEDSVQTFFAADTGIERTLYYDRKKIPETALSGLCYACDRGYFNNCTIDEGDDCNPESCSDCEIFYSDNNHITNRRYEIRGKVGMVEEEGAYYIQTTYYSTGGFKARGEVTKRKIELTFLSDPRADLDVPLITDIEVSPLSTTSQEGENVAILAHIMHADGLDEQNIKGRIDLLYNDISPEGEVDVGINFDEITMSFHSDEILDEEERIGGVYKGVWDSVDLVDGSYQVIIKACAADLDNNNGDNNNGDRCTKAYYKRPSFEVWNQSHPLIEEIDITYHPRIIKVGARIGDVSRIGSAWMVLNKDNDEGLDFPGSMRDDGIFPDEVKGDGIYTGFFRQEDYDPGNYTLYICANDLLGFGGNIRRECKSKEIEIKEEDSNNQTE